jgi:nuclear transport factor 2 (NTF2) superfamily protein
MEGTTVCPGRVSSPGTGELFLHRADSGRHAIDDEISPLRPVAFGGGVIRVPALGFFFRCPALFSRAGLWHTEARAEREANMSTQALRTEPAGNPRTIEEARALVAHVESLFMPWNIEALAAGFTEDCEVRFGSVQLRGRAALRAFFEARCARQKNYRLRKRLRTLSGDSLTNIWEGEWEDAQTGARMQGFGVELWVMRQGKIASWEAAFNVSRADADADIEAMLR